LCAHLRHGIDYSYVSNQHALEEMARQEHAARWNDVTSNRGGIQDILRLRSTYCC
jgi:hypothetical protein